jgi:hypothetical protein
VRARTIVIAGSLNALIGIKPMLAFIVFLLPMLRI